MTSNEFYKIRAVGVIDSAISILNGISGNPNNRIPESVHADVMIALEALLKAANALTTEIVSGKTPDS